MEADKIYQRCFLSGPANTDLSLISSVLSERGITVIDLYDFTMGDSILQLLKQKIRSCDFCIFVLSSSENQQVLFEIGVCEGLGKPYFIFLQDGFRVPFYLENEFFGPMPLDDRDVISGAIANLIRFLRKKNLSDSQYRTRQFVPLQYPKEIHQQLENLYNDISSRRFDISPRDVEDTVKRLFEILGLTFAANTTTDRRGADFVIWNDKLDRLLGNQIVVEIKAGRLTSATLTAGREQLRAYIEKAHANIGILLYLDRTDLRIPIVHFLNPFIFSYDIADFIKDVAAQSFEGVLLTMRNKIAHRKS